MTWHSQLLEYSHSSHGSSVSDRGESPIDPLAQFSSGLAQKSEHLSRLLQELLIAKEKSLRVSGRDSSIQDEANRSKEDSRTLANIPGYRGSSVTEQDLDISSVPVGRSASTPMKTDLDSRPVPDAVYSTMTQAPDRCEGTTEEMSWLRKYEAAMERVKSLDTSQVSPHHKSLIDQSSRTLSQHPLSSPEVMTSPENLAQQTLETTMSAHSGAALHDSQNIVDTPSGTRDMYEQTLTNPGSVNLSSTGHDLTQFTLDTSRRQSKSPQNQSGSLPEGSSFTSQTRPATMGSAADDLPESGLTAIETDHTKRSLDPTAVLVNPKGINSSEPGQQWYGLVPDPSTDSSRSFQEQSLSSMGSSGRPIPNQLGWSSGNRHQQPFLDWSQVMLVCEISKLSFHHFIIGVLLLIGIMRLKF